MSPLLVMFKGKKLQTPVSWCCYRALWNRAWGTSGNRWLLLVYVDMGFKFLILSVWDICFSTPFGLHQSSQEIFLWAFAPSPGVIMSTSSPCGFWLTQLSTLLWFLSAGSDDVSDFSWPCESQQAPGQTRTHLPKKSCRRSDIPLLSHWAHPSNFFFPFFPPLLSLFVWFDLGHWWQGCFSCQTNQ